MQRNCNTLHHASQHIVELNRALASALARSTDPSDVALLRGLEALKGEATPYAAVTPVAAAPTDEAAAPAEDGRTLAASALGKGGDIFKSEVSLAIIIKPAHRIIIGGRGRKIEVAI